MEPDGQIAKATREHVKRALIIGCLVAVCSACSSVGPLGRNELPSSSPRAPEIRKALNQSVIPMVDLKAVSLQDAVKFWSDQSRTYHPQHFDFRHVISYPMTFSMPSAGQAARPTVTSSAVPPKVPTIMVHRKNITAKRLLDEICRQSNFTWTILGRVIVIKPSTATTDAQP